MSTTAKHLTVDVISDVACPWCWVGKRAIEVAAANLRQRSVPIVLELRWHPFQLDPSIPQGTTTKRYDRLVQIVGSAQVVDQWIANNDSMPMNESCAASHLPNIHFKMTQNAVGFNTYRAHTLLTYIGKVKGDYAKQNALKEALLRMTHGEEKNLDSLPELTAAAKEAGVASSEEEVQAILNDEGVKKVLNEELAQARRAPRFNGVPYFTFSNGTVFSGGQPVKVFENALLENV